jgi:SAM-dependent methyltransferase
MLMGILTNKRFNAIFRYYDFIKDFFRFKKLLKTTTARFGFSWADRHPVLHEKVPTFGFDRHYLYHPAWAARVLARTRPSKHIDISSSLYFNAIASAFVPIDFFEFRPADLRLHNFTANHADILKLPFQDNSVESISCMHVIEHIGLGRYGDPIDPDGDLKAIQELIRVLAPQGTLLFVVPMGNQTIEFNAHRLYSYEAIMCSFRQLTLKEFAYISDDFNDGGIQYNPPDTALIGNKRGCGCFWFTKERGS